MSVTVSKHRTIKAYTGSGGKAPRILNVCTRGWQLISYTLRPLYSRYKLNAMLCGPQRWCGCDGEEENLASAEI